MSCNNNKNNVILHKYSGILKGENHRIVGDNSGSFKKPKYNAAKIMLL